MFHSEYQQYREVIMHVLTLLRNCFSDVSAGYFNAKPLIIDDIDRKLKKLALINDSGSMS